MAAVPSRSIVDEVLEKYRQGKLSTQMAAQLLNMSHSEFTRLASERVMHTSTV